MRLKERVLKLEIEVRELRRLMMNSHQTGGKLENVKIWLLEQLPGKPAYVQKEAREAGIGIIILKKAKAELGVVSVHRSGQGWFWERPITLEDEV